MYFLTPTTCTGAFLSFIYIPYKMDSYYCSYFQNLPHARKILVASVSKPATSILQSLQVLDRMRLALSVTQLTTQSVCYNIVVQKSLTLSTSGISRRKAVHQQNGPLQRSESKGPT